MENESERGGATKEKLGVKWCWREELKKRIG